MLSDNQMTNDTGVYVTSAKGYGITTGNFGSSTY